MTGGQRRHRRRYQFLYATERKVAAADAAARVKAIEAEIEATGTYVQTFDELEHGIRVAWRNAPKCGNRKHWEELQLLDLRACTTNAGMAAACVDHITKAVASGVTDCFLTAFRPHSGDAAMRRGPRVWNDQLLGWAGYKRPDGTILGDPRKAAFTEMIEKRFGWKGPANGRTQFDILPLVVQIDPDEPPELFPMPASLAAPIAIWHPKSLGRRRR